jgi:predicted ribosomally synthesized peptide with SipW-like signal peptide
MKKRTLALLLALALGAAGAIGGTVAWLTAKPQAIVNTFTTSDIAIALAETTGQAYQMIPGCAIRKDPAVTVLPGSEACYLFVKLEASNDLDAFLTYDVADGWTPLEGETNVYWRAVQPEGMGAAYSVIKNDQVAVRDTVTQERMAGLTPSNRPALAVTAFAAQYEKRAGEPFTAAEAWSLVSGG